MCNIFISHKHEDEKAAKGIADLLKIYGGDNLEVFISESIPAGDNWRNVIVEQLSRANLLILLFTEPRLSWDWCLYETGLFMDLQEDGHHRVICIHTPLYDPPDPIKHLEAIPAQSAIIKEKFLKVLFGETIWTGTSKPISSKFADDDGLLESAAQKICSFFDPKETDSMFINRYCILSISDPKTLDGGVIPGDATVRSRYLSNVFGVVGDESQWQLIVDTQQDPRWIQQLEKAIKETCDGLIPEQIQGTFLSKQNEVIRPVLYRVDTLSSGAMEFYLLLVSDVSGKGQDIPVELMTMGTVLRMSTRFRYEVIEGYQYEIQRSQNEEDLKDILVKVRESITVIESESLSRMAIINENTLRELFKSQENKDKIVSIFDRWYRIRQELFNSDVPLNKEKLLELFNELRQINSQFMCFSAKRYSELVNEKMAVS